MHVLLTREFVKAIDRQKALRFEVCNKGKLIDKTKKAELLGKLLAKRDSMIAIEHDTEIVVVAEEIIEIDESHYAVEDRRIVEGLFSETKFEKICFKNTNTSQVTNMCGMFSSCEAKEIDFTDFDTSQVTCMCGMFSSCKVKELDLSSFDTSRVTDMSGMFRCCDLEQLDLSSFDTSNVKDMTVMFSFFNIEVLDLSHFDTSSVERMRRMFFVSIITDFVLGEFNTSHVTDMGGMFNNFSTSNSIDISCFDFSSVQDIFCMFVGCDASKIIIKEINNNNLQCDGIFNGCRSKLETQDKVIRALYDAREHDENELLFI